MLFYIFAYLIIIIAIAYFKNYNVLESYESPITAKLNPIRKLNNAPTVISKALTKMNIDFDKSVSDRGDTTYRFFVKTIHMNTNVVVADWPDGNEISVVIRYPVLVPRLKQNSVFEFIGMINYNNSHYTFEMDHRDGEFRLRSYLEYKEWEQLSKEKIIEWLNDEILRMDQSFPGFIAVAYGNAIPSEIWDGIQNAVDPKLN